MKTNLFKAITAASTAALMLAIPVSSAYAADSYHDANGVHTTDTETFGDVAGDKITDAFESTGNVYIKIDNAIYPTEEDDEKAVYNVDVTWEDLTFTYISPKWNTTDHLYEGGTWDKESGTITVTNHSNWGITHAAKFDGGSTTASKELYNVKATITPPASNVIAACPINATTAPSAQYTVNVGLIDSTKGITTGKDFVLDTITVTITPTENGASNEPT